MRNPGRSNSKSISAGSVVASRRGVELFPRKVGDKLVYEFKLHELRHTAASLRIHAGAKINALQNKLEHQSLWLTLDRYGHLYESDVEAVGLAMNTLLTRDCGQTVGTEPVPA